MPEDGGRDPAIHWADPDQDVTPVRQVVETVIASSGDLQPGSVYALASIPTFAEYEEVLDPDSGKSFVVHSLHFPNGVIRAVFPAAISEELWKMHGKILHKPTSGLEVAHTLEEVKRNNGERRTVT